ncbi:hypothetical protein [Pandoraea sp. NPDC087047]|uniref:hypothetical protein n=1 Tax=Pandoraea sp. NPDC087047 TaxID=3364390 RepID=UPI00380A9162
MKAISNLPGMPPVSVTPSDDTATSGPPSPATNGPHHAHHRHAASTSNTARRRGRGAHDPAHAPDAHEWLETLHELAQHHPSARRRKSHRRGATASADPGSQDEMDASDEDEALIWEAIAAQEQALERLVVQVSARDGGNERDQKDREREGRREASLRAMSHASAQLSAPLSSPNSDTGHTSDDARPTAIPARTLHLAPSEFARTTSRTAIDAGARPASQEEISAMAARELFALGNRYRSSRNTSMPGEALMEATRIIGRALAMPVAGGPASRRYATLRAVRHALVEAIRRAPPGSIAQSGRQTHASRAIDRQDAFLLLLPLMMLGLAAPVRSSQLGVRQARQQAMTRERLPVAEGLRK